MGANWGKNLKLSIFGESHGKMIGINIDGVPAGIKIDMEYIEKYMAKRAPNSELFSTSRKEQDKVEIISGVYEGITTGAPLCAVIKNENQNSKDYIKLKKIFRPSHSDYPAYIKFNGFNDIRGGGHFSGRLTAPIVFAGAFVKSILTKKGINIGANIIKIGKIEIKDRIVQVEDIEKLNNKKIAILNDEELEKAKFEMEKARKDKNSIGGVIECTAFGVPTGLGNPFFDSLESTISHLAFSIPSIKGIEFGKGFDFTEYLGSEINDEYFVKDGDIKTYSNNNGGIVGGLTTGMPIVFRVVIKPTPSILKKQRSVDFDKMENCELEITGQHDSCIVPRIVAVIEAITAIAILEHMLEGKI